LTTDVDWIDHIVLCGRFKDHITRLVNRSVCLSHTSCWTCWFGNKNGIKNLNWCGCFAVTGMLIFSSQSSDVENNKKRPRISHVFSDLIYSQRLERLCLSAGQTTAFHVGTRRW